VSEIDYERVQFLHDVATDCARDGTEIAIDADEVILYLTKPLLALRERAEPDQHEAHIRREVNAGGNTWIQCSKQAFEREKARGALCRVLYESPPAPVVDELKPVGYLFVSDRGEVVYSPTNWHVTGLRLIGQIYGDISTRRAATLAAPGKEG